MRERHASSDNQLQQLALVTGASSGIGLELARQLAEHGYDLVVNAEDEGIHAAARELVAEGVGVVAVRADLATTEGVEALWRQVRALDRPVDVVAINAGIGAGGAFVGGTDWADERRTIDLNVTGSTYLAKLLLPSMVARGAGRVLFTASVASTSPGPYLAVYAASKAYVLSLAEAIRYELRDSGVSVTALMPGATDTPFFERADMLDTPVGRSDAKDDPAEVARVGFEALMRGDDHVVVGFKNKTQVAVGSVLPEPVKAAQHAKQSAPDSEEKK